EVVARLSSLELLIVLDHLPGALTSAAPLLLPAATGYESAGIFVNRAGRAQAFAAAAVAGEPVAHLVRGGAFPRQPRHAPPLSDPRPSWWALERIRAAAVGQPAARDLGRLRTDLARAHPRWAPLAGLEPGSEGAPLDVTRCQVEPP